MRMGRSLAVALVVLEDERVRLIVFVFAQYLLARRQGKSVDETLCGVQNA